MTSSASVGSKTRVLVVEDEVKLADLIQKGLEEEGYHVDIANSAENAQESLIGSMYDAFVIDIMLPAMDGIALCGYLRDIGVTSPILMLTARNGVHDKVDGLDSGADDYMTKPFEFEEMLARLRALLRKGRGYHRSILKVADLEIDPNTARVFRAGIEIELSKKEFMLLEYLVRNKNCLLTRPMISKAVWNSDNNTYTNIIDVFITYLRKKIDQDHPVRLIRTIRGRGFMVSEEIGNPE